MEEEEKKRARDDVRCESAVQTIIDVLRRFDETSEGSYTLYDLVGYMAEDLIRDGFCAACMTESLQAACKEVGADTTQHRVDGDTIH